MKQTEFNVCPRVKKGWKTGGEYQFDAFRLFTVGEGDLFARSLGIFIPSITVKQVGQEEANLLLTVSYIFSSESEYCRIRITECGVEIQCRDNIGARNASAILAQIIEQKEDGSYVLPCGIIEDWPDAQYRAMMFDNACRMLIPMERLYRYIREMALCRMNVVLYHFMSEKGNSIQMDTVPNMVGFGEENFKFNKDEIRAMISYAADLGVRITPFIQVISHVSDFPIKAGIACPGDSSENLFDVCLGQEKTFEIIDQFIKEVTELFPDDVVHIGADEHDMRRVHTRKPYWDKCPHCQKLSKEKGFTTLRELYLYGIARVNRIVNKYGKVAMLWNADLKPGQLPVDFGRNMIVHYYRANNPFCKDRLYDLYVDGYVEDGFSVLNSYYPQTYLDYASYMNAEKLNGWSYLSDPHVKKLNRAEIPGACCCAWGKHEHYIRAIPAAIPLFADRLWNAAGDSVPYDNNYGKMMTRILFDKKLPEDMNVFSCIGGVLPPLDDGSGNVAHINSVQASIAELKRVKDALCELALVDELAKAYADAVEHVLQLKLEEPEEVKSPEEKIAFLG